MKMPRPSLLAYALAGLLGLLVAGSAAADSNIVVNGGFETGSLPPWTTDAWTVGSFPGDAFEGNFYAELVSDPFLSQTLATVPGQSYTLSFAAAAETTNTFNVLWDGGIVPGSPSSINPLGLAQADYQTFSFTVTAASSSTVLEFDGSSVGVMELDAVSVVPTGPASTPEPGSLALLLGMGVTGAGFLRKRRCR